MSAAEELSCARPVPRLLAARVDHLRIAFQVEVRSDVKAFLRRRARLANDAGGAAFCLGQWAGAFLRSRDPDRRFPWRNGRARGLIDLDAAGGFVCEVTIDGENLLDDPDALGHVRYAAAIAAELGDVRAARLRRVDLCGDFVDFDLQDIDRERVIFPRGAHLKGSLGVFSPETLDDSLRARKRRRRAGEPAEVSPIAGDVADTPAVRTFDNPHERTGLTICAGGTIMARLYNKSIELRLPSRAGKAEVECARWAASRGGYDEARDGDVTRVEFQILGEAIEEAGLRDPERFLENLDGVWAYLTQRWVRLIERPEDLPRTRGGKLQRRERCPADPRWWAVRDVRWREQRPPIVRRRRPKGASFEQAMGAMWSCLAANRGLPPLRLDLTQLGTDPEVQLAAQLLEETERAHLAGDVDADRSTEWLTGVVVDMSMTFALAAVHHLTSTRKKRSENVRKVATKLLASYYKHAVGPSDPTETTPYFHVDMDEQNVMRLRLAWSKPAKAEPRESVEPQSSDVNESSGVG